MEQAIYVVSWREHTMRVCAQGRVIRRSAAVDSLVRIDRLSVSDLCDGDVVRELRHFTGDRFFDGWDRTSTQAWQITESAFRRLSALQQCRSDIAELAFNQRGEWNDICRCRRLKTG